MYTHFTSCVQEVYTAQKVFKYGVISGPYFPVFRPKITPYLDTFHAVIPLLKNLKRYSNLPGRNCFRITKAWRVVLDNKIATLKFDRRANNLIQSWHIKNFGVC